MVTVALGYLRVSTEEQSASGLGLAAQRDAIMRAAAGKEWQLEWVTDAGYSGKDLRRPGITAALERLDAGDAQVLVVAKLDRVSRSVSDFAVLLERAKRKRWAVVSLELGIDMTTPMGELIANIMSSLAQWERRVIGERTSVALQAKKATGARLGAPIRLEPDVRKRILTARKKGIPLRAIAEQLNADRVPTASGAGSWHHSTVRAVLRSIDLDKQSARARRQQRDSRNMKHET